MKTHWWIISALALAAIAAMVGVQRWGGIDGKATSILRKGTRIEVFRVSPKYSPERTDGTVGGYPILSTGTPSGPEFATRLATALRSWGVSKGSNKGSFEPAVAFRVWDGDRALDVLLCFDTDELWAHVVGDPSASNDDLLDFAPVRAELVALVKEAFPDNAKIQGLPALRP